MPQAAEQEHVDTATVRRWAAQGKIRARRLGGRWIIDAASLARHRQGE